MPCHSDPEDEQHARLVANHFKLQSLHVPLERPYDAFVEETRAAVETLEQEPGGATPADDIRARVPIANVKPRLRMTTLYFVANSLNYLVAGTGNRCEIAIGYYTKYGDGGVDLLPIGHLLKSQVRVLARQLGVPEAVITRTPSAGLWPGQTDEAEMGFTYDDLERYLVEGPESLAPALALRIERLIRASEHKRSLPPTPEISDQESA
jgi:NAD+ synthase